MTVLTIIFISLVSGFLLGAFITLAVLYVCFSIKDKRDEKRFRKLEKEIENEAKCRFN